jgi:ribosome-binding factor A
MNWHLSRLREELHKEIGQAIAERMNDPRIPEVVTITEVRLGPDCRNATVFVSVMGSVEEGKVAVAVLNHAAPFLQHVLSKRIVVKFFPKIYFKLDKSMAQNETINKLLIEIKDDLV